MTIVYKLPIVSNWLGTAQKWAAELRKKQPLGPDDFIWKDWDPTFSCSGAMTISGVSTDEAIYCAVGGMVWINLSLRFTLGGVADTQIFVTPPVDGVQMNIQVGNVCAASDAGGIINGGGRWRYTDNGRLTLFKPAVALWALGAGAVSVQGFYRAS